MDFVRLYTCGIGFRETRNCYCEDNYRAIAFVFFAFLNLALSDIRRPPSLVMPTQPQLILQASTNVTMTCQAHGISNPKLRWFRDGVELRHNEPGLIIDRDNWELKINSSRVTTGDFHCLVRNEHAALVSPPFLLRQPFLTRPERDWSWDKVKYVEKYAGEDLVLSCGRGDSDPPASWAWRNSEDYNGEIVKLGGRKWVDDSGNLHFTFVSEDDDRPGPTKIYKCFMENNMVDVIRGMNRYNLKIKSRENIPLRAPTLMFSTESPLFVLEGSSFNLKCIFSGYPQPNVVWSGPGLNSRTFNNNYEVNITNFDVSKNGTYVCEATNEKGTGRMAIEVLLRASPKFKDIYDGPYDRNVTNSDEVVINCLAHAEPPATVVWYKDGQVVKATDLPENYQLSSGKMTITNVCKSCANRTSDLTVIQCTSTNQYGILWGTGYINVLERTRIKVSPNNGFISPWTTQLTFNCSGTSDDSTEITTRWFKTGERDVPLRIHGDLSSSPNLETLVIRPPKHSDLRNYVGNYSCAVTNGYSTDWWNFTIAMEDAIVLPMAMKSAEGSGTAVGVIFILLFLLIMLALLVYRNHRCATYLVDEKERENGNEPEKELESNGFLAYSRPEGKSTQGSHLSLISSGISYGNMSLSEYGDTEAGKYDEDGSFIGNYAVEIK